MTDQWDPNDLPESQQRLADALEDADAPDWMVQNVKNGLYHDYASKAAGPKMLLVQQCQEQGLHGIAQKAIRGRYDP